MITKLTYFCVILTTISAKMDPICKMDAPLGVVRLLIANFTIFFKCCSIFFLICLGSRNLLQSTWYIRPWHTRKMRSSSIWYQFYRYISWNDENKFWTGEKILYFVIHESLQRNFVNSIFSACSNVYSKHMEF